MTTGQRIRAARVKAHMTQAELADKLHTSYVVISQYENGKRNPKLETIKKIADALGVMPSTLLDEASLMDLVVLDNNMTGAEKLLDLGKKEQNPTADFDAVSKKSPAPAKPGTGDSEKIAAILTEVFTKAGFLDGSGLLTDSDFEFLKALSILVEDHFCK